MRDDNRIQSLNNHISMLQSEMESRKRVIKRMHENQRKAKRQLREAIEIRNKIIKS